MKTNNNNNNKMFDNEIEIENEEAVNFFDNLLSFPSDNNNNNLIDTNIFNTNNIINNNNNDDVECPDFPPVWSQHSLDFSADFSLPYEDIVQLEWLSTFVEDSFSGQGLTLEKTQTTSSSENKDSFENQFCTSSPISVLESSTTSARFISNPFPVTHEKRARSKRPRPPTFTPRAPIQFITPMPTPVTSSESGNLAESYVFDKRIYRQNKKKKVKILPPSSGNQNQNPNVGSIRKCKHCEITETPQWRSGPMGPKSLCNACGVRYNKGRLYPEYRPAASPTFVPSLHSNSDKKVLEMRGYVTKPKP